MSRGVIILGGGGHARSVADVLQAMHQRILGFTDPSTKPELLHDIAYLGNDDVVQSHNPDEVLLVNGLGSVGQIHQRQHLFEKFHGLGYIFAQVHHPAAVISSNHAALGHGCQVLAGTYLGPGVILGDNVLINTRAVVEHDCCIGKHSHVATAAILCGQVEIGESVHVGAGAIINQGIKLGDGAVIASGAVVIDDVKSRTLMAGTPAQVKKSF